jgi:hypothetical protein
MIHPGGENLWRRSFDWGYTVGVRSRTKSARGNAAWGTGDAMTHSVLQLEVAAGADPLVRERLTNDLCRTLLADPGIDAAGLVITSPQPSSSPGAKGPVTDVVAVLVAGTVYARPVADVLIAAVQSWCARDRRISVKIRDGDRRAEFVGSPTRRETELIERFFSDRGDNDS